MTMAKLHIRAKTAEIWDAVYPFVKYGLKNTQLFNLAESQCGMICTLAVEGADKIYSFVGLHKLPITIEMDVEAETAL
jgi:hypothetical protein